MIRVLALALLLVPGAARGNPLDAFGFGARAPAMGGAHTALSSDASANYYNPGALGAIETIAIDAGYQLASPSLSINGGDQDVDTSRGVHVGLVAPGQVAGVPLAIGMAAFIPDERFTRSRTLAQERVRWALYDNRPQRVFLAAHLSVRVVRGLTVGAGVAFMSRTQGDLVLGGRLGFPNASDSDLAPAIDFDLVTVRYPQAGLLWEAAPWLSVGVTYRHPFVLEIEQAFRIEGDIGPTEADALVKDGFLSLLSRAKDLFQPLQVALGVSVAPDERWRLAVDVVYQRWSAFDNPSARIDLDLDLGDFDDLVDIPPPVDLERIEFRDIIVPRVGLELEALRREHATWNVRAGYAYERSPAPPQTGVTNLVDGDKHTLSAGLGVTLTGLTDVLLRPFDVDMYVAYTLLPERAHRKVSAVDPVGDYVSSGSVLQLGMGTRWRF